MGREGIWDTGMGTVMVLWGGLWMVVCGWQNGVWCLEEIRLRVVVVQTYHFRAEIGW